MSNEKKYVSGLTLTILTESPVALSNDQGYGNYSTIKKYFYKDGIHAMTSVATITYELRRMLKKNKNWELCNVVVGDKNSFYTSETLSRLEADIFGFLVPGEQLSKTSPLRIIPFISVNSYKSDTQLITNKGNFDQDLGRTFYDDKGKILDEIPKTQALAFEEVFGGFFYYTITIELDRFGVLEVGLETNEKLKTLFEEIKTKEDLSEVKKIIEEKDKAYFKKIDKKKPDKLDLVKKIKDMEDSKELKEIIKKEGSKELFEKIKEKENLEEIKKIVQEGLLLEEIKKEMQESINKLSYLPLEKRTSMSKEVRIKALKDILDCIAEFKRDIKHQNPLLEPLAVFGGIFESPIPYFWNDIEVKNKKINLKNIEEKIENYDLKNKGHLLVGVSNKLEYDNDKKDILAISNLTVKAIRGLGDNLDIDDENGKWFLKNNSKQNNQD